MRLEESWRASVWLAISSSCARSSSFIVSSAEASWPISSIEVAAKWASRLPPATWRAVRDSVASGRVTDRTVSHDSDAAVASRIVAIRMRSSSRDMPERPTSRSANSAVTRLPTQMATTSGEMIFTTTDA
jgi:hypothetical protein